MGAKEGEVLAASLSGNSSLTEVNLDGYALPVKQLKGTEPVKSIDLSSKGLSAASAHVIAALIWANGSITEVC